MDKDKKIPKSVQEFTTIAVKKETKVLLLAYGNFGETYDDLIRRLIKGYNGKI